MNVMFYFRHHYEFSLFTHHSSLFFWWNLGFHWNSIMTLTIYLFTMPRTVRTPDSFHWKLGLWLLQFNSPASFFVIFVHSKFVPFLTHSSTLKWKFIFRILDGSNSEFQIKISKFWITLTGIIWCSASKSRDVIKTIALISSSFTTMISHVIKPPLRSVIQYLSREPEIKYRPGFGVNPWWRIS